MRASTRQVFRKILIVSLEYVDIVTLGLKQWVVSYQHFSRQEARLALIEKDIHRGTSKREMDEMRKHYIEEKCYTVAEKWKCKWWSSPELMRQ